MNLFGREYSGGIDRLWNDLDPKPCVREYSPFELVGKDQRFGGDHQYISSVGDEIRIAPHAHEYTLAHELMHVILRRKQFHHMTFRPMLLDRTLTGHIVAQLESASLHPILNRNLRRLYGIEIPAEHVERYVSRCRARIEENSKSDIDPHHLVLWALIFLEMAKWHTEKSPNLRAALDLPEAWDLANTLLAVSSNLENGSPQECRAFSVKAVRMIDAFLHPKYIKENNLYFKRVMFPPPPFLREPESGASSYFDVRKRTYEDGTAEVEIVTLADDTLCWTHPIDINPDLDQYIQARDALNESSTRDFTAICEQFYPAVSMGNGDGFR